MPKKIVELAAQASRFDVKWDLKNETQAAYAWAKFLYVRYRDDQRVGERVRDVCVRDAVECSLGWAEEANAWVCGYVFKGGVEELQELDLGGEYFDGAVPIVEEMIVKGGRRLARWLMVIAEELEEDARRGGLENDIVVQEL